MPKLRRLNGYEVIVIFQNFGFVVLRIRGSHHMIQRIIGDEQQVINVPVHGNSPIAIGTLKAIYRQGCQYIPTEELKGFFYG